MVGHNQGAALFGRFGNYLLGNVKADQHLADFSIREADLQTGIIVTLLE